MSRFLSVLLFCLLSLPSMWAADVTFRVFNGRTTPGVSAAVSNIGQSQHLLWLQYTNSGGSCGAGSAQVFLRVNAYTAAANCALTVWYSGSTDAVAYPQTFRQLQSGYLSAATSATSTTGATLVSNTQTGARVVLYGWWVHNAGAANTGELYYATDASCTVISNTVAIINLPSAGAPSIWPVSIIPYASGPASGSLCWRLGGAGNATVTAVYRVE